MVKRLIVMLILCISAPRMASAFTLSGFDSPDSVIIDPETGSYYVSNMAGNAVDKDGNGYISKITPNGNILIQKYIGGKTGQPLLDAPKGLLMIGKLLYVADIDKLKVFDKTNGRLTELIDFSSYGDVQLNDLAVDGLGNIYISDRGTHRIYKMNTKAGQGAQIFSDDLILSESNGIAVNPRTRNLMVVIDGGGKILEIDGAGRLHTLKRGLKGLSGIDYDIEGNLFVTSRDNDEVYRIPYYGRGVLSTYLSGLAGPVDIACDRKKQELVIPSSKEHTVTAYPKIKKASLQKQVPAKKAPSGVVSVKPQRAK